VAVERRDYRTLAKAGDYLLTRATAVARDDRFVHHGAGVRAVRVADDERQVLLDVSRKLEYLAGRQLRQAAVTNSRSAGKEGRAAGVFRI
jgi:hypothetical protein